MKLNKTLNFIDIFFAGYGHIIGAGIYTLLGFTTKYAGNYTWLSFIIGGLVSLCTGLSYAHLSQIYTSNSAEYEYISETINQKLGSFTAIILILLGIVTITTLSLAFSFYLNPINISKNILNLIVITIPTIINIISIKYTSISNIIITCLETAGLLSIILFSFKKWNIPKLIKQPLNTSGILRSSFLTIFAYLGFEHLVKLNEETINPKINIPKGIVYSILTATIVYVLISISTLSILGHKKLSISDTPISNSAQKLLGENFHNAIDIIAIISISSSILLGILSYSRLLYGIAKKNVLPKFLSDVNPKTKTPIKAILVISVSAYLLTFLKNVELSTTITNFFIFIVFTLVNLASIIHKYKSKQKIPIYSIIGIISTAVMSMLPITSNYFKVL